ncbi:D-tyrosyl-tRNA(Tyr) deacylase [Candidatus Beckwithbacteria bacterium RBG_13_42_9]|uniref:D-aminoacyl-tRNA deacylase n=1 Tax=Candidatus Beckwithbacteria bacterium RBG_13_42_9 TaxID=1797457 RepID=A0A1F5E8P5_9BACT|nr:MAG: D-tyrosyl-tRNA(Tyr) deacylase [Candidatus Beckwithbacteria bacterium RBG_13_42_9]
MKLVIQRVSQASVSVNDQIIGQIEKGLLILIGVAKGDTKHEVDYLVSKVINLRIFADNNDKMNLSIKDVKGSILVVSQFTLYGDTKRGNRPSFVEAAEPKVAEDRYNHFVNEIKAKGIKVETGKFRVMMQISLVNDGPVTIILER